MQRRHCAKAVHLLRRVIAHPNRADFPLLEKPPHRLGRLFNRYQGIRPMHLVNINVGRLQPAQRIVHFAQNSLPRGIPPERTIPPLKPNLCRQDHFFAVPVLRQSLTDDLFRPPKPVQPARYQSN